MEWLELSAALVVILAGSEFFTNGVEWAGEQHGLSEGVVGSVLAAVGTALPETILPLIAISLGGAHNEEIGIGAILGAPFMLATLAMFVLGAAVLIFARGNRRSKDLDADAGILRQDFLFFLVMYAMAVGAALVHLKWVHWAVAVILVAGYVMYVRRHLRAPGEAGEERQAEGEVKPLYAWVWTHRRRPGSGPGFGSGRGWSASSPKWWTYLQVGVALVLIIGGSKLFVSGVSSLADKLNVSHLVFALLLAPIATELPEKFNSVLWSRRKKDTLALGNITGAMVFQSAFPVAIGLVLTPWRLTTPALVSAAIALLAGFVLYLTVRLRGKLGAGLLLFQGVFYVGFVLYVLTRA